MPEEVEGLEDHAHLLAYLVQVASAAGYVLSVDYYVAAGGLGEHVYAPEQRALAGAGRSYYRDDVPIVYRDIYVLERDGVVIEHFPQVSNLYH